MKSFEGYKKGVNLGGWISQCDDHYNDEHYSTFILREDIEKIAGWGADHVRLPFDYNVVQNEDGTFIESGFTYIDNCLSWCKEFGLNVVLDLHKTSGFVFDKEGGDFFTDALLQKHFKDLWIEMAKRYGKYSFVSFELLNEVTKLEMAKPWNKIIKETVPLIREYAPDTTVIVGGIYNSSIYGLSLMEKPIDDNMVYTFHCYSPMVFTHQSAGWFDFMPRNYHVEFPTTVKKMRSESLKVFGPDFDSEFENLDMEQLDKEFFINLFKEAIKIAIKYDVALYCGEYGVIDQADESSTLNWIKEIHTALEVCEIGRSIWTYKEKDFGLIGEHYDSIRDEIIKNL